MSTTPAFQQAAAELLALLGAVDTRLEATRDSTLSASASVAGFHAAVAALRAPAAQRALAEDGGRWLELAGAAQPRLAAVAIATKGTAEGAVLARALGDCTRLLERLDGLLVPAGPPVILLAGGAAAAFALAWFLFREHSQVSLELDMPEEEAEEEPAVEYLPPQPSHEPQGPRESYELDEIEDAEFEPA